MPELPGALEEVSKSRLLVVDDEAHVRVTFGELLRRRGYHVEEASSGQQALAVLQSVPCDLMVLDMLMPGMSGVEVMKRARQMRPDLLIIVLTAHATVDSAIAAVKSDITDYMLKPCSVDDLAITISRALQERANQLRRQRLLNRVGEAMGALLQAEATADATTTPPAPLPLPSPSAPTLRVGSLTLDRDKRLVTVEDEPIRTVELTEGEAAILIALMEHPNQVFSCSQLADAALGYEGMDKWTVESVVRSSVFRLRQKIETAPDSPRLICTVRGRGYYLSPA